MSRKFMLAIAAASFLGTAPILAQQTGPNGGLLGGAGSHQTELIVSPSELTVYLVEGGKVIDSKGATNFRAVVQQGAELQVAQVLVVEPHASADVHSECHNVAAV